MPTHRKSSRHPPWIVAHRGASQFAPENTLEAFDRAWQLGVDAIECDVHLTSDGIPVCIHDQNTWRMTHQDYDVAHTTWSTLRHLRVYDDQSNACRIPLLIEVLRQRPAQGAVFVDLKTGSASIPMVINAIRETQTPFECIRLISFKPTALRRWLAESPSRNAAYLLTEQDYDGIPPRQCQRWLDHIGKSIGCQALGFEYRNGLLPILLKITPPACQHLHLWGVNSPTALRQCMTAPLDAITTDLVKEAMSLRA